MANTEGGIRFAKCRRLASTMSFHTLHDRLRSSHGKPANTTRLPIYALAGCWRGSLGARAGGRICMCSRQIGIGSLAGQTPVRRKSTFDNGCKEEKAPIGSGGACSKRNVVYGSNKGGPFVIARSGIERRKRCFTAQPHP